MKAKLLILFLFFLELTYAQKVSIKEIEIDSLITGNLFTTENSIEKPKLAIIIAGSGPTNRSGNQIGSINNSLKFLAEAITSDSIHTFSFDKRIIKQFIQGKTNEKELRFEDFVNDVKNIIAYFKKEKKYSKIILIGHSQGSLVGILASKKADAFISIAGTARPIDEVIIEQIKKDKPFLSSEIEENFKLLKKGNFTLKSQLTAGLFRESIQPFMRSWVRYNPQKEIKKIKKPILIINGTTDLQVPPLDAKLLKEANPKAKLVIIENMNHVLKNTSRDKEENLASYNNPELPIVQELSKNILDFINSL